MGTILYSHGVDRSFDELNITHTEQVQHVHEAYIHAGANVIQTNTYGANYIKLSRYGLEEQMKKINQEAVRIANRARNGNAIELGKIIPNLTKLNGVSDSSYTSYYLKG